MSTKRGLRFWTRSIFNVPRWIGWSDIKKNATHIHGIFSQFTHYEKPKNAETFDEAVNRLELTEADLEATQKAFYKRAVLYFFILSCTFAYNIFLLIHGYFVATLMTMSINFMMFSFFFRQHFWYVQIRTKKLGLTVREWLDFTLHSR